VEAWFGGEGWDYGVSVTDGIREREEGTYVDYRVGILDPLIHVSAALWIGWDRS
jgi:hypothetical protein